MNNELISEFVKDVNVLLSKIASSINALERTSSQGVRLKVLSDINSAASCITELVDGEDFEDGNDGVFLKIVER